MRSSLRLALAGLLALAAFRAPGAPTTQPAAGRFQPFFFIHAGDPQMGMAAIADCKKRFIALGEQANRLNAAFVIAAGDLVHTGRAEEWQALEDALKTFRVPVKPVRGNHDPAEAWSRRFGQPNYVFAHNGCRFVVLDSNVLLRAASDDDKRRAEELLAWADRQFRQAVADRAPHVFLVMHHPPLGWLIRGLKGDEARPMSQPLGRLMDMAGKAGVRAVLCGHIHMTGEFHVAGTDVYTVGGTAKAFDRTGFGYRVWKVFADHVEQQFVPLDKPLEKVDMRPTSRPAEKVGVGDV